VGLDELLPGPEIGDGGLERDGMSLRKGVVVDHALDARDPVPGEVLSCAGHVPCRGNALLVGLDFGVGEANVVIVCGIDKVESDRVLSFVFAARL